MKLLGGRTLHDTCSPVVFANANPLVTCRCNQCNPSLECGIEREGVGWGAGAGGGCMSKHHHGTIQSSGIRTWYLSSWWPTSSQMCRVMNTQSVPPPTTHLTISSLSVLKHFTEQDALLTKSLKPTGLAFLYILKLIIVCIAT